MVVISVNAVVDPHGRLLLVDKTGFNELKLTVPFDNRTGKALALRQCDYDTIILGTSRAESGIAVDQPPFDAARTYNAALKAATMYEMRRLVEYALQYRSLRRVVIGLDFVSFNEHAISFDDFDDSPLASPPSAGSLVRYLLSWRSLRESWVDLKLNRSGRWKKCISTGERAESQRTTSIRKAFDFILKRYASGQYWDFVVGENHFDNLQSVLAQLDAAGVEVQGFISPMHVMHQELLREMDYIDEFDNWKRRLVLIFESYPNAALWDFSGYSEITTERVPADEDADLRWYTDSSHYRQPVGNFIITKMNGLPESVAPDFGVRLGRDNIESVIEAAETASTQYRQLNPDEIRRMQEMLEGAPYPMFTGWR